MPRRLQLRIQLKHLQKKLNFYYFIILTVKKNLLENAILILKIFMHKQSLKIQTRLC